MLKAEFENISNHPLATISTPSRSFYPSSARNSLHTSSSSRTPSATDRAESSCGSEAPDPVETGLALSAWTLGDLSPGADTENRSRDLQSEAKAFPLESLGRPIGQDLRSVRSVVHVKVQKAWLNTMSIQCSHAQQVEALGLILPRLRHMFFW